MVNDDWVRCFVHTKFIRLPDGFEPTSLRTRSKNLPPSYPAVVAYPPYKVKGALQEAHSKGAHLCVDKDQSNAKRRVEQAWVFHSITFRPFHSR